jgi:hypothetical protein
MNNPAPSQNEHDDVSLPGLLRELRDETSLLFRQEVALAKAELGEKASIAGRNGVFLAMGGLIAYAGLLFLLVALSFLISHGLAAAGLSEGMAAWLGPLIVGLIVGAAGLLMVWKAKRAFAKESFAPEKTIASLKENKEWGEMKLKRT